MLEPAVGASPAARPARLPKPAPGSSSAASSDGLAAAVWRRFRRHRGAVVGGLLLGALLLAVLLAPLSPYSPDASNLAQRFLPPSWAHPMGTDPLGRDLLTRVLVGGRISLAVGFLVVAISLALGVTTGALAGYLGGAVDNLLMRLTDAALALPSLLVLILLSALMRESRLPLFERSSVFTIALVIGGLSWMTLARLVRASVLTLRETDFVIAARGLGASPLRIIFTHILLNTLGPIIVEATLELGYAIIEESGLSFLGFGIQPPTPSWGNLLSSAQAYFTRYPWLAVFPGLMIFLAIIAVNYLGDGLRDAFDPRKQAGQAPG